jgi:hypothetical protein
MRREEDQLRNVQLCLFYRGDPDCMLAAAAL